MRVAATVGERVIVRGPMLVVGCDSCGMCEPACGGPSGPSRPSTLFCPEWAGTLQSRRLGAGRGGEGKARWFTSGWWKSDVPESNRREQCLIRRSSVGEVLGRSRRRIPSPVFESVTHAPVRLRGRLVQMGGTACDVSDLEAAVCGTSFANFKKVRAPVLGSESPPPQRTQFHLSFDGADRVCLASEWAEPAGRNRFVEGLPGWYSFLRCCCA